MTGARLYQRKIKQQTEARQPAQLKEVIMFKKILVGYDGSKGGKAALERAAAAAQTYQAQLTALWVRQPLPRHADLPGEPEGEAEAARRLFRGTQTGSGGSGETARD